MRTAALAAALAALGGCFGSGGGSLFGGRSGNYAYSPPPGSEAFRALHLERTSSIVILKIAGDDVRSNAAKVSETLIRKGYAVRDYSLSLRKLVEKNLLDRPPMDPEVLKEAAKLFDEPAAIAGTIRLTQSQPLRIAMELNWVDLKTGKTLWTVKGTHSSLGFGGMDKYEAAVQEMVEQALAVIPRAQQ